MYLTVCPTGVVQGIFFWLITCASLYTVQGGPKARTGAETVVKARSCTPLEKRLQSREDHGMLTTRSTWSTANKNKP